VTVSSSNGGTDCMNANSTGITLHDFALVAAKEFTRLARIGHLIGRFDAEILHRETLH